MNIATAFILRYRQKYFLVTNYHILAGQMPSWAQPNEPAFIKGQTPNLVSVYFYNRDHVQLPIPRVYWLLNQDNTKRLFKIPKISPTGGVVDMAYLELPLDSIPKEALIDPVDVSSLNTNWLIPPKSKLIVCGFRGNDSMKIKTAIIDTVITTADYTYSPKDKFIFARKTIVFEGHSGGLVYFTNRAKKEIPVAMPSIETKKLEGYRLLPGYEGKVKNPQLVYHFVALSEIISEIKSQSFK